MTAPAWALAARVPLAAAGGCVVTEPAPLPWPSFGGVDAFVRDAEPVLVERCASPSCHGDPGRPLALYAVHRHRLDPADTFRDGVLTAEEQRRNFVRSAAFLLEVATAADSLLLRKPLAVAAGGAGHVTGPVFLDVEDAGYRRLRDWAEWALAADAPAAP